LRHGHSKSLATRSNAGTYERGSKRKNRYLKRNAKHGEPKMRD